MDANPEQVNMGTGKDFVRLEQKVLNVGEIVNLIVSPKCGAISTFIGTTRDNFENKKVIKLEYEAYEPMALKEMNNICAKIRSQWNIEHIAIYHRLGEVPVTEASVVIAVSSPHRQESLRAVEYAINTLKASVPIWKKEIYDIEEPKWKENKECIWSNSK
ncbi:molybdopterin synthase catalytic subunit-like isoform X1 [Vespa velutina]|uniref:molybdopterin synthase catalytic subunit-like isoform X1 n=1 Tax=Vespa velutina TaxID=202808 RepID=UPI001FB4536C|nr:molybdopterin synthase catalytic subunit-like isoform X1 [Vespa velutina]